MTDKEKGQYTPPIIKGKKLSPKVVQKAYFLDQHLFENPEKLSGLRDVAVADSLPAEFYRVLGKVLKFIELVDEDSEK